MDANAEKFTATQFTSEGKSPIEQSVAREILLTIFLNGKELVTLLCSPKDMKYLVVGFLVSEGLLKSKEQIKKIEVDEWEGVVRVETDNVIEPDSRFFLQTAYYLWLWGRGGFLQRGRCWYR
jgi:formate dehydrogenase assembly factor FdhD